MGSGVASSVMPLRMIRLSPISRKGVHYVAMNDGRSPNEINPAAGLGPAASRRPSFPPNKQSAAFPQPSASEVVFKN